MNLSAGHIPDSLNRIVEAADDLFAPYGDEADVYVVESILHREIGRMALQARSGGDPAASTGERREPRLQR